MTRRTFLSRLLTPVCLAIAARLPDLSGMAWKVPEPKQPDYYDGMIRQVYPGDSKNFEQFNSNSTIWDILQANGPSADGRFIVIPGSTRHAAT